MLDSEKPRDTCCHGDGQSKGISEAGAVANKEDVRVTQKGSVDVERGACVVRGCDLCRVLQPAEDAARHVVLELKKKRSAG